MSLSLFSEFSLCCGTLLCCVRPAEQPSPAVKREFMRQQLLNRDKGTVKVTDPELQHWGELGAGNLVSQV